MDLGGGHSIWCMGMVSALSPFEGCLYCGSIMIPAKLYFVLPLFFGWVTRDVYWDIDFFGADCLVRAVWDIL